MDKDKAEVILRRLGWLAIIGVGLFYSAVIAKSVIELAVGIFVVLGIYFFVPVLARAMAHGQIKSLLWLAKRNPLEELITQRNEDFRSSQKLQKAITELSAERDTYGDRVLTRIQKYGVDESTEQLETYARLVVTVRQQQNQYTTLMNELKLFDEVIERVRDDLEMARLTDKANTLVDRITNRDPMSRIMRDTSVQEARKRLHAARARADMLAVRNNLELPALEVNAVIEQIKTRTLNELNARPVLDTNAIFQQLQTAGK